LNPSDADSFVWQALDLVPPDRSFCMPIGPRTLALAGVLLFFALLPAGTAPAFAQAQKPATTQAAPASFTEVQLDQFATAAINVYRINNKHSDRWRAAAVPAEKTKIQAEAKAEQEAAIKNTGLTLQTYSAILAASKNDATLNQQIADRIKAKTPS